MPWVLWGLRVEVVRELEDGTVLVEVSADQPLDVDANLKCFYPGMKLECKKSSLREKK